MLEKFKSSRKAVLVALAVIFVGLAITIILTAKAYGTEARWDITIGNKTIVAMDSEENANKVIKGVKKYYLTEGSTVEAVTCDPKMKVVEKDYDTDKMPEVLTVDEAIKYIVLGTESETSYTVVAGDTIWSIAETNGLTVSEVEKLNSLTDESIIKPGDALKIYKAKPFVNVTTNETITEEQQIAFKTTYENSSSLSAGQTQIKTAGVAGKQSVTAQVTKVNGVVTKSVTKESKVITAAKDQVVLKGTAAQTGSSSSSSSSSYGDSGTYSGNGTSIANYAKQFVGNPYVYGGTSLTNGADCSGFVMSVYRKFGISLPHSAVGMRNYGREVSLSEAKPGDILCYEWHVSIYIGGGKEVHAIDEDQDIGITPVGWSRGELVTVRRLVE